MSTVTPPRPQESRSRDLLADAFSGTPGRMRVFGAVSLTACLLFGVLAFFITRHLDNELESERDHAAQLVRVQTIRTSLVKANAAATNAFLVAGLEAADARGNYEAGINTAAETLAEASSADQDDIGELKTVNQALTTYTGMIESARANNRQGFPVGAAYLRAASKLIEDEALPALERLVNDELASVDDSSNAAKNAQTQLVVLLLVALAALIGTQIWLFVKTHRVFNPPFVLATALVLGAGVMGLGAIAWALGKEKDVRETRYVQMVGIATARINAYDAKSAESLTLIARGSGAAYEEKFQATSGLATAALTEGIIQNEDGEVNDRLQDYLEQHGEVRTLDDRGDYDAAVALATGDGAANTTFAAFEVASADALETRAAQLADDLSDAQTPLGIVSVVLLLAGLFAALAANRGISHRLREYR